MLFKFTGIKLQPILLKSTKFRSDNFKTDKVIEILIREGCGLKLPSWRLPTGTMLKIKTSHAVCLISFLFNDVTVVINILIIGRSAC